MNSDLRDDHIAIIGMSCRFPGAANPAEYWQNLAAGVESITSLTDDELRANGLSEEDIADPTWVKVAPIIDEFDGFDARFFGMTAREAEIRDPQSRMFLESCYAALEDAGYDLTRSTRSIGVFGGGANDRYSDRVVRNSAVYDAVGPMAIEVSNAPDYLTTSVSYRLGLRGPSINVQTACSTSLVAVHLASQALRAGECDMALAGGVEVELPYACGYQWTEGSIYSRTGHVRAFDAGADGTIFGTGVGVVLLRRLGDALAAGDHIYGVIRASAVNNDGSARAGFTAPGVEGQAELIAEALAVAEVDAASIGYVEAHATGTLVGDPIEIAGLTKAFGSAGGDGMTPIPVGSAKPNVGHLGPAAGMAGLIKVCLALQHELIPPTINYDVPNPNIDMTKSPFYVVTEPTPWPSGGAPRRAGISSFGIGGTNGHLIVEEPPAREETVAARRFHLVPLAAKTATALDAASVQLGRYLKENPDAPLADVGYTLQVGRAHHPHRRAVVAAGTEDAAGVIGVGNSPRTLKAATPARPRRVAFLFPGQGAQYPDMGRDLYDREPVYRDAVDECAEILRPHLDMDLRELLMPAGSQREEAARTLAQTRFTQPAMFVVEYALAQLYASWGVRPDAMLGHSIGEYAAAHLAGVFSLPDVLGLVAARGRLMQAMEPGAMLALPLPISHVSPMLPPGVEVAATNSPVVTVLAGPTAPLETLARRYNTLGMPGTMLHTSHAFHSAAMEPMLDDFRAVVRGVVRNAPTMPFVSNVTGTWITAEQAVDPDYWADHLRRTVRFSDGLLTLGEDPDVVLLEVGPGDTLSAFARQAVGHNGTPIVTSMRHPRVNVADDSVITEALGRLWVVGVSIDWELYQAAAPRTRVALPTYPFERKRYWIDPDPRRSSGPATSVRREGGRLPIGRSIFTTSWAESPLPPVRAAVAADSRYLVLSSGEPVVEELIAALRAAGAQVVVARPGAAFGQRAPGEYVIRPSATSDLARFVKEVLTGGPLDEVVHAFCVTAPAADPLSADTVAGLAESGFYSLLALAQELAKRPAEAALRLTVLTSGMQSVAGNEAVEPAKALVLGPTILSRRELPGVTTRAVDIDAVSAMPAGVVARLLRDELAQPIVERQEQIAWRGSRRWVWKVADVPLDAVENDRPAVLRDSGVYLITGGLGGIGLSIAEDLARKVRARVVLMGRRGVPPREDWELLLDSSDTAGWLRQRLERLVRIEKAGGEVLIAPGDVTSEDDVRAAVEQAERVWGTVDGVFHCAGVAGGGMLALRARADAEKVLAPKVTGVLVLDRIFGADSGRDPDFVMLFSSVTAVTGEFGMVDYCAANNFLDAYARRRYASGARVYSLGYTAWNDVGMANDAEESAPAVFRDLQSGSRSEPAVHPLLDRRIIDRTGKITFSTVLAPNKHWVSTEHTIGDLPALPGTALVEMTHAAFSESVGGHFEIGDVVFLGPVSVAQPTELRVILTEDEDGHAVSIASTPVTDNGGWVERFRARVRVIQPPAPAQHDVQALIDRCDRMYMSKKNLESIPDRLVRFGPHWNNLNFMQSGDLEEIAEVQLDAQFADECGQYALHPSLFDDAVNAQNLTSLRERGDSYLPFAYGRIVVSAPLPPRFFSYVRHLDDIGGEIITVDVLLIDPDGRELVKVEGYALRRVDAASMHAIVGDFTGAGEAATGPVESATAVKALPDSLALDEQTGVEALRRILHWSPTAHTIVCPEGLEENIARMYGLTASLLEKEIEDVQLIRAADGERMVDAPYVAPENELQRTLAGLWASALGVREVGIDDNFFELGGNSLVAVQLGARLRSHFATELPMAALFEQPTVRTLATLLERDRAAAAQAQ